MSPREDIQKSMEKRDIMKSPIIIGNKYKEDNKTPIIKASTKFEHAEEEKIQRAEEDQILEINNSSMGENFEEEKINYLI